VQQSDKSGRWARKILEKLTGAGNKTAAPEAIELSRLQQSLIAKSAIISFLCHFSYSLPRQKGATHGAALLLMPGKVRVTAFAGSM